jgi:RNA polymerase sigma factor for flagellar operon FliA
VVALLESIDRFDARRGVRFEVYARFRIHGEMMECLRSLDWVHRSLRSWGRKIEQARAALAGRLIREPAAEEIARELGISMRHYYRLDRRLNEARLVSFDQVFATGAPDCQTVVPQFAPGAGDPQHEVEKKDLENKLAAAVQTLPERQRRIVELRYYRELPFKEIARELGVSEARVCQILADALARLRVALNGALEARPQASDIAARRRPARKYWKAARAVLKAGRPPRGDPAYEPRRAALVL